MAQTPRQQGLTTGPQQQLQQQHQSIKPKAPPKERPLVTTTTTPLERISKLRSSQTSISTRPANDSCHHPSPLPNSHNNNPTTSEIFSKYQPNRVFLNKCRLELKSLLGSIEDNYHNDIKLLYTDEQFTDLFIKFDEDDHPQQPAKFNKPLHKCLIISRAFKLFSALKSFKIVNNKTDDKDIIISQFQADIKYSNIERQSLQEKLVIKGDTKDQDGDDSTEEQQEQLKKIREEKLREALEVFHFELPNNLINSELLLSFVRRVYLNQDLQDEEAQLVRQIVAWLKQNKPELVKPSVRCSPDHRESFRTIQPNFDQLSINDESNQSTTSSNTTTTAMSTHNRSNNDSLIDFSPSQDSTKLLKQSSRQELSDLEGDHEETTSQNNSFREESSTGSLLTRTETFELISKSQLDSPTTSEVHLSNNNSNKNMANNSSTDDDEGRRRSETGGDDSENSSEPYVPTTRTGLKPKKFTTPVGMSGGRSQNRTASKTLPPKDASNDATEAEHDQRLTKSDSKRPAANKTSTVVSRSGSLNNKQGGSSQAGSKPDRQQATATKLPTSTDAKTAQDRSKSNVQSKVSSINAQTKSSSNNNSKTATTLASSSKLAGTPTSKPTVIVRAHPISIERSQSPGTNLVKVASGGSGSKNFIAANKRLVAQMDKKLAQLNHPTDDHRHPSNHDLSSDAEASDSASLMLPFESLTTENLAAHLDRYTLAAHSKLAESLSRMFIDEISLDCSVHVRDGKQIGAHRCVLAARSPYFSDVISQQQQPQSPPPSITSSSNKPIAPSSDNHRTNQNQNLSRLPPLNIDLSEFSYSAAYFSILHIYSGIVKVPDDLDLEELAKISHLLHVGTLRQVCMHNLLMSYCHFFHKPCQVCCQGVLKALPLAWRYDYTELYSKCLNWIGSHFAQIFCLEEFSKLKPHDLIEECYSATLAQLTPDNVIQKTVECQKLLKNLPRVKWTESVICLVGRQLEDFCHYVADNYEKILQTDSFLSLGKSCWECEVLEENLLAAMNHLKPDSGCRTLIQLDKIECSIEGSYSFGDGGPKNDVSESFASLIAKMRKYCERYLLKEATSVVHCGSWRQMNPSLQKRIKDQALLATDFDEPTRQLASKPKLPSTVVLATRQHQLRSSPSPSSPVAKTAATSGSNLSGSEGTRSPSNRSTPDSRLKSPSTTYLPPPKNKQAATRQVKVLK